MTFGLPRGRAASLKQVLRHKAATFGQRIWTALETTGRLHAAPILLQQADRLQSTQPDLADALRRVARPTDPASPAAATTMAAAR